MKNGAEAFKAGFEKAVKNYDQLAGYGKETAEADVFQAPFLFPKGQFYPGYPAVDGTGGAYINSMYDRQLRKLPFILL
jgi:hypothetical protein